MSSFSDTFADWGSAQGEPDDGGTGEDCACTKKDAGYWFDVPCTSGRYVLCEFSDA